MQLKKLKKGSNQNGDKTVFSLSLKPDFVNFEGEMDGGEIRRAPSGKNFGSDRVGLGGKKLRRVVAGNLGNG